MLSTKSAIFQVLGKEFAFPDFHLGQGEAVCLCTSGDADITVASRILSGEYLLLHGEARIPVCNPVNFEYASRIIDEQRKMDDSDLTDGAIFQGIPLSEFIRFDRLPDTLVRALHLTRLLDRGIRFLSNGEMRKALTLRALYGDEPLVILEDPFDGLDQESSAALCEALKKLPESGRGLLLLLNHTADIPDWLVRVHFLAVSEKGFSFEPKKNIHLHWNALQRSDEGLSGISKETEYLIAMKNIRVTYEARPIFSLEKWQVRVGEHWLIRGPNGAGKSTLLGMITGDNVKAYGQDVEIFGVRKGSGETIWDIKRLLGIVSRELHLAYKPDLPLLQVILSGFFDSIGLYQKPSLSQTKTAIDFATALGWDKEVLSRSFHSVGLRDQRLTLILRALVKFPKLLILDEPCQGLDDPHREAFLESLSGIVASYPVTTLYVTHRQEEIPQFITNRMVFEPRESGFEAVVPEK